MSEKISLPNSKYINIDLGLKYLNGNKKLYLKVLHSFLTRYQDFDINSIEEDKFKNEMHTLKGLTSTLGMEALSNLAKNLHHKKEEKLQIEFSKTLKCIISDLNNSQTKTLLIIDDNSNDIDKIIQMLENRYDIMVISTPHDELEHIEKENIAIALLNPALNSDPLEHILKQKKVLIINLCKPIK